MQKMFLLLSPPQIFMGRRRLAQRFYRSASPKALLMEGFAAPESVGKRPGLWMLLTVGMVTLLASCKNDKIEVYRIPKEGISVAMQSGSAGLVPPAPSTPAQWTKPEGWSEQPLSEMRLGSFKAEGPNAASADISVIAFPGEAGGLLSNINRWRGQLQLPPLDENQLSQSVQRTEVSNVPTYLVDFQTAENAAKPSRILGAVLQTADRAWFVKMSWSARIHPRTAPKVYRFRQIFPFYLRRRGRAAGSSAVRQAQINQ